MAAPHLGPVSPEEYLRMERQAETRHELVNGVVYAMSGASFAHVTLVGNLYHHIRNALPKGCRVLMSDMRVGIHDSSLYIYPDLSVVCGDIRFDDSQRDTITNPLILVEVLSPSTEAYDRGAKFLHYCTIPSLRVYVLVAQDHALVECRVKNDAGDWILHVTLGLDSEIALPPLDILVSLRDIYEGVDVSESTPGPPRVAES